MSDKLFTMKEVPPESIMIEDRARQEIGDITDLKNSIRESGQLNPILVTKEMKLIAGERRTKACKELKINVLVRIMPDLKKDDLLIIERMENEARKDFLWHEELRIRYKLHKYWQEMAKPNDWFFKDTAKKLDCSISGLSTDLTLYEGIKVFPELINLETKGKAREAYKKLGDQAIAIQSIENLSDDERDRLKDMMKGNANITPEKIKSMPKAKHENIEPITDESTVVSQDETPIKEEKKSNVPDAAYVVQDVMEFIPSLPNNVVGLIELDPPYAIDFNTNYGKVSNIKANEDDWTIEKLFNFYKKMLSVMYDKLLDNSWIICWTGKEHWLSTNEIAKSIGFKIQYPGIWSKTGGTTNTPKTNMISSYEMFLLFRKGNATFNTNSFNSVINFDPVPASKRTHQWEKPLDMYRYLMTVFGKPGSIFVSPFAGSGNSMLAAAVENMIPMGCDQRQKYAYSFYDKLNNYFMD